MSSRPPLASDTKRHAELLGLVALLMLFVAFLQGLVLSRRVTRPLRALTAAAGNIATELPAMVQRMQTPGDGPGVSFAPLPVKGKDEIGRLARAFNEVNETTVRVALEQAALRASIATMFVNVARRNQALLGRQLSVLERLEQHEEDPDTLEELFQVDHLTTRMQRNAESLLVLAGIDTARRSRQPLLLSDVVRTAISEIEEYPRVDLEALVDPQVDGRHVLVTAHLLAELLENATRFSDPATRVEVRTYNTSDAVIVSIADHGLGMPDDELELARHKMSLPPASEDRLLRPARLLRGRAAGPPSRRGRQHRAGANGGTVVAVALPLSVLARTERPVAPSQVPALPPARGRWPNSRLPELDALPELDVVRGAARPVAAGVGVCRGPAAAGSGRGNAQRDRGRRAAGIPAGPRHPAGSWWQADPLVPAESVHSGAGRARARCSAGRGGRARTDRRPSSGQPGAGLRGHRRGSHRTGGAGTGCRTSAAAAGSAGHRAGDRGSSRNRPPGNFRCRPNPSRRWPPTSATHRPSPRRPRTYKVQDS